MTEHKQNKMAGTNYAFFSSLCFDTHMANTSTGIRLNLLNLAHSHHSVQRVIVNKAITMKYFSFSPLIWQIIWNLCFHHTYQNTKRSLLSSSFSFFLLPLSHSHSFRVFSSFHFFPPLNNFSTAKEKKFTLIGNFPEFHWVLRIECEM